MQPFTAHALNHWQDSPDALPAHATTHTCPIKFPHSHLRPKVSAGITTVSHELARMREHPELYFDWQLDAAFTAREAELHRLNLSEWDCGTCKRWVVTPEPTDPCPKCGAP